MKHKRTPTLRSMHGVSKPTENDALEEAPVDRGMLVQTADGTTKVLTAAQRSAHLEELLSQPFPLWTEFYVLDRIHRVRQATGIDVSPRQILIHAMQKSSFGAQRMETVLDECRKANLLECHGENGPEVAYRLTQLGLRCLAQAKQVRLRLWELNRSEDLASICASVALQGGDPISERVQEALELLAEQEKDHRKAASAVPRGQQSQSKIEINPLWSGLVMANK